MHSHAASSRQPGGLVLPGMSLMSPALMETGRQEAVVLWSGTLGPGCPLPQEASQEARLGTQEPDIRETYTQHWPPRTTGRLLLPSFWGLMEHRKSDLVRLPSAQARSCWILGHGGLLQHKRDRSSLQSKWTDPPGPLRT